MQVSKGGLWLLIFSSQMVYGYMIPNDTERDLLDTLFQKHNRHVRPVCNPGKNTDIYISTILNAILDVNEREQSFKIRAWFNISWYNEFLVWNSSRYSHIPHVMIEPDMIWMPDLVIYNSNSNHNQIMTHKTRVILHSDGQVSWAPGGIYTVSCAIRVHRFPFDHQHCSILVSKWYLSSIKQIGKTKNHVVEIPLTDYQVNTEWMIQKTKALCHEGLHLHDNSADCCFSFTIQRRSQYYVIHMVIPAFVLSYLMDFSFLIPHTSGEKLSFVVTLFLAFSLVIDQFDQRLPITSLEICYFSILIKYQHFMRAFQTCATVLIVHLSANKMGDTNGTLYHILKLVVDHKPKSQNFVHSDSSIPGVVHTNSSGKNNLSELKTLGEQALGSVGKKNKTCFQDNDVNLENIACALNRYCFYVSLFSNTVAFVVLFLLMYIS